MDQDEIISRAEAVVWNVMPMVSPELVTAWENTTGKLSVREQIQVWRKEHKAVESARKKSGYFFLSFLLTLLGPICLFPLLFLLFVSLNLSSAMGFVIGVLYLAVFPVPCFLFYLKCIVRGCSYPNIEFLRRFVGDVEALEHPAVSMIIVDSIRHHLVNLAHDVVYEQADSDSARYNKRVSYKELMNEYFPDRAEAEEMFDRVHPVIKRFGLAWTREEIFKEAEELYNRE